MPCVYPYSAVKTDFLTDNKASGGTGGSPFKFIKLDQGAEAVLTRIKAWKGDSCLRGLQVWMSDGTNFSTGHLVGTPSEFSFQIGELITGLNVQANKKSQWDPNARRMGAIYFETSKNRKWGIYTNELSDDDRYWQDVGSGICVGVFGASGHDIDRLGFAMLRQVGSAILTNVTYPKLHSAIVASTQETAAHQEFSNGKNQVQTVTMKVSKPLTITREWSISTSLPVTTNVQVRAGIPTVAGDSGRFSWTISAMATLDVSTTEKSRKSWKLTCPAHTKIVGDATMFVDNINTEYNGVMELHLKNGKTYKYPITGIYKGRNLRSDSVTTKILGPYQDK